jgi:hypothetical protein
LTTIPILRDGFLVKLPAHEQFTEEPAVPSPSAATR